jgi:hypothetical protein
MRRDGFAEFATSHELLSTVGPCELRIKVLVRFCILQSLSE